MVGQVENLADLEMIARTPGGAGPLLILGASGRAAAQSAVRVGFTTQTIDLFADADLAALCPVKRITDYPGEFEQAARSMSAGPWMFTGGLENYPLLVDRIAAERPLLGNAGHVLSEVRDPQKLAAALHDAGLRHPRVSISPISTVRCLRKPRNSSGGLRISFANGGEEAETSDSCYFQEFITGTSMSAIYVAANGQSLLLGVTRQLIGEPWSGAGCFQYCGSIGPLELSSERRTVWQQIGACLANRFGLQGLFGVDAIENEAGIWPVEVNPRYTASVEVLERGLIIDAIAMHVAACQDGVLPDLARRQNKIACGKAVLYAQRELAIDPSFALFVGQMNDSKRWPAVADVPHVPTQIPTGQPIVTIFAEGDKPSETESNLQELAKKIGRAITTIDP